eukprot:TRINITY_DN10907_c0_g1_i2.p1 TRINITY_DN10907_c0_g1~~TRINITY_DN10907_c0_g1_i2.p1  ORF type:complete len:457 (+),score=73.85 TRINITY_DN10907_c0_g1_i2:25-1371(+)
MAAASGERRARLSGVSPLARASKRSKEADAAKILKEADTDEDGMLSLEELQSYLGDYLGFGEAEIRAFFEAHKTADSNKIDLAGLHAGFANLNPYVISKRTGELIVRKPGSVCAPGGQVNLEELTDSTVLICDRSEQAFVDVCNNCQVLIGPCDSSVFVRDCKDCTFWVVTRQLRTRDCVNCKFFLHTHTEPIIESSTDLGFAPFAASYPGLSRHFEEANMNAGTNYWNALYDFSGRPDRANWYILPLVECIELSVNFINEPGVPDCPSPAISHAMLCAKPLASAESSGQSVAQVTQTQPALPAEPTAGAVPKRQHLCDGKGSAADVQSGRPASNETAEAPAANGSSVVGGGYTSASAEPTGENNVRKGIMVRTSSLEVLIFGEASTGGLLKRIARAELEVTGTECSVRKGLLARVAALEEALWADGGNDKQERPPPDMRMRRASCTE